MIHDRTAREADSSIAGIREQTPRRRGSVLFVLPAIPWPLRRSGVALRFAPILEHLARRGPVDVLVLAAEDEPIPLDWPTRLCRNLWVIPVGTGGGSSPLRKVKTFLLGLSPWGIPFGASPHIARRDIQAEVLRHIASDSYSSIIWGPGFLDIACRVRRIASRIPFIVDFTDSPALAVSRARFDEPFMRLFRPYTVWKWRRVERQLHRLSDASIYVSPVDAIAARPRLAERIHVIPNGISTPQVPLTDAKRPAGAPIIGFLGDMSYPPNVSAVLRLANVIFPRVRRELSNAELLIIGRNPAPEIRQLHSDIVTITGEVQDIWEFISRATVFAFPMMEGSGLQNKILEAMYAGIPVVSTTMAAQGLGAAHGTHLLIADSDEQIAAELLRLTSDRTLAAGLSARAASFVNQRFCWSSILPRYENVITGGQ